MKKQVMSFLLAIALCLSLCVVTVGAENLLSDGAMSSAESVGFWVNEGAVKVSWIDAEGASAGKGYIEISNREKNFLGAYLALSDQMSGTYRVTCKVRCAEGESQTVRVGARGATLTVLDINDQWTEISAEFTATEGTAGQVRFLGGTKESDNRPIYVDDVVLEALNGAKAVKLTPAVEEAPVEEKKEEKPADAVDTTMAVEIGQELVPAGTFDDGKAYMGWNAGDQKAESVLDGKGANDSKGYVRFSNIALNYKGFIYKLGGKLPAGTYKLSGAFKTADPGAVSQVRIILTSAVGSATPSIVYYNIDDQWMETETYVTVQEGQTVEALKICGGGNAAYVQPYCVDNLSLIPVDPKEVPEKPVTVFGDNVTGEAAAAFWKAPEKEAYDAEKEAAYEINGLMINQDADGFLGSCGNGTATVESLKAFARQFKDSHITDYIICVNNTNASYPSKVWSSVLDKYTEKEQNGQKVNWSDVGMAKGANHIYNTLKTDYISLWIDEFNDIGIKPWISFRMNDAHDLQKETSVLLNDFFHENVQLRRVQHHDVIEYYDNCMDYGKKEVRDHMLALIEEALGRYDMYGVELDFQREIWLFKIGGEYAGIEVMNQFMRDVHTLVEAAEKKRGHDIKVAVRVASDVQTNMDFGLDVMQWVHEGLVNTLVPTGRWDTTDNDMPIKTWSSMLLAYPEVELAAGIEGRIHSAEVGSQTLETLNGSAANFYSQGADKIYLYNHYRVHGTNITQADKVYVEVDSGTATAAAYWQMITTLGSAEKVMTQPRRLILTYNDTQPLWKPLNSWKQLPRAVDTKLLTTLRIPVGDIPEGSKVTVKLSCDAEKMKGNFVNVYANSQICEFLNEEVCTGGYTKNILFCYDVPADAWSNYLTLELNSRLVGFTVDHLEVCVIPAE